MICVVETTFDTFKNVQEVKVYGSYSSMEEAKKAFLGDGVLADRYTDMGQIMPLNNGFIIIVEMEHPYYEAPF